MHISFNGFYWDLANSHKCERHGVTQEEIESLFGDNDLLVSADYLHSVNEDRFCAIGVPRKGARHIFVIFTLRNINGGIFIRPITARYMHKKEIRNYEETLTKTKK